MGRVRGFGGRVRAEAIALAAKGKALVVVKPGDLLTILNAVCIVTQSFHLMEQCSTSRKEGI